MIVRVTKMSCYAYNVFFISMLAAVMCPTLLDPLNGNVFWTDVTVNSGAIYTCNSVFELIGSKVRSCLSDGVWSSQEPVCTGI